MNLDRTIDVGTDIANFCLFPPDDLKHCEEDLLDWVSYGFACRKEFEKGNLIGFRTGSDGSYRLRITDGDLIVGERQREVGSWEFGYTVRHGRVAVDNGDYRVTAHAIKEALGENEDSLTDYVIRFEPVKSPLGIAHSPTPSDLIPREGKKPGAVEGLSADGFVAKDPDSDVPLAETYPVLTSDQYVLPGGTSSVRISDELYEVVTGQDRKEMFMSSLQLATIYPEWCHSVW